MKLRFLGTASNGGWPQQDCRCSNCQSARNNHKLIRLRSSLAFLEDDKKWSIIDCGPDFRQQLINQDWLTQDIGLIILTHLHPDHSSGLVELGFGKKHRVNISVANELKLEIRKNPPFNYLLETGFARFIRSKSIRFVPISHWPGHNSFAISFGKNKKTLFAPDCALIDNKLLKEIKMADLIIFDGTFFNESKFNHLSIMESSPILGELSKPVIFTHINHSENVDEILKFIKKFNFRVARDNMEIEI